MQLTSMCVPDSISNNTKLCTWFAGIDGFISATPGGFHQSPPNLVNLTNQEGFWGVTMVTIQIHLSGRGSDNWLDYCRPDWSHALWYASFSGWWRKEWTYSYINVDDISIFKWPTTGHVNNKILFKSVILKELYEWMNETPIYLSGMPWQTTLFTDVQTDLGKPPYLRGDG